MNGRHLTLSALALSITLAMTPAQADVWSPGSVGGGATIRGKCGSTGQIATTANVHAAERNIELAILEMGRVLASGQTQQIEADKNLQNQMLQASAAFDKDAAAARARARYLDQTTGANAVDRACENASLAERARVGGAAAERWRSQATAAITARQRPATDRLAAKYEKAKTPESQWKAATLTDPLAAESDVRAAIEHLVSPFPPQAVTPDDTPAGDRYKALTATHQLRRSLANEALTAVAMMHRPAISAETINQAWAEDGMPDVPPGRSEDGAWISQMGLLTAQDRLTYSNPEFHRDIQVKDEVWQIKQYAISLSRKIHAQQAENALLERVLALQAALLAKDLEPEIAALDDLRRNAASLTTEARGAQ